mmetsp:Transcript_3983/g.11089  ORF Transcript_3983/g.11089 Transcript_3983/m.11089 type:complete len:212 (-) Transcript_3983:827-1462(-)
MQGVGASRFDNEVGVGVHPVHLGLYLADAEDDTEGIEADVDRSRVVRAEEVAEERDDALGNKIADLVRRTAGAGIGQGPGRLLLDLELRLAQELDDDGHDAGLDDVADLLLGPRGDVGDGPARLLPDALVDVHEHVAQSGEGARIIEHGLRLPLITGYDVSHHTQRRRLHRGVPVRQEFDHLGHDNVVLNDGLNALVGAVGQVGQRPARIG